MLNVFKERVWSLRGAILLSGCRPRLTVCELVFVSWSFLLCRAGGSRTKCHPLDHTADVTELRRRKTSRRGVGEGWGRACCLRASRPTQQSVLASSGGLLGVFSSHKHAHTQTPTSSPLSSTHAAGLFLRHSGYSSHSVQGVSALFVSELKLEGERERMVCKGRRSPE